MRLNNTYLLKNKVVAKWYLSTKNVKCLLITAGTTNAMSCCHSVVICLMLILWTCWATFVFMCSQKSNCLSSCHAIMSWSLICHMSYMSLGHSLQVLFSCLGSKLPMIFLPQHHHLLWHDQSWSRFPAKKGSCQGVSLV